VGLVFPSSRGTLWTDFDWRNWRKRVYGPTAKSVGLTGSRPYDLRHSFASLLIHEGVSVLEVARQVGNSSDVTLTTYAHVFEEFEPGARVSAVEAIEAARMEFDVRDEYAETPDAGELTAVIPHQRSKPTRGLEPRTPSLRVKCSTS
jgi:hypothetical protein